MVVVLGLLEFGLDIDSENEVGEEGEERVRELCDR